MPIHEHHDAVWNHIQNDGYTDRKGCWQMTDVIRTQADRFEIWLWFRPAEGFLKTSSTWPIRGNVFANNSTTISMLKASIKDAIGYMPLPTTLQALYAQFDAMRNAYQEEDQHVTSQDASQAQQKLEELLELAVQRYMDKKPFPLTPGARRSIDPFDRYLSRAEQQQVRECCYIQNGTTFIYSDADIGGLTFEFRSALQQRIYTLKKADEARRDADMATRHRSLLDTDPQFRRIASHIVQADYSNCELAYRLFGYANSVDEWRDVHAQLRELLRSYLAEYYKFNQLAAVIRSYVAEGNLLPPVQPIYERDPKRLYYNDAVQIGSETARVVTDGRRYVQTDMGRIDRYAVLLPLQA